MDEIAEDEIEKTFNKENEDIFTDNTNNKDDIDFTKK
jgi:hypothetical protein